MKIVTALCLAAALVSTDARSATIKESLYQKDGSIALTFDACGGTTDMRILRYLAKESVHSTIFATGKWIRRNKEAVDFIKANRDVFKVENHGMEHLEAAYSSRGDYGLKTVGDEAGLRDEVFGGAAAVEKAFGTKPTIYRDAGALYDPSAASSIRSYGMEIGGYEIAGDEGAKATAREILRNAMKAKPGDVMIFHINKPKSSTYAGLILAIQYFKKNGERLEWLN